MSAACCTRSRKYARPASISAVAASAALADDPSVRATSARHTNVEAATACAMAGRTTVGESPMATVISPPTIATALHPRHGLHAREPWMRSASAMPIAKPITRIGPHPVAYTTHAVLIARGRGADVEAAHRREPCFHRDRAGVAGAAGEQQHDEERKRRVRDEVRSLEPRDGNDRGRSCREDEQGHAHPAPTLVLELHWRGIGQFAGRPDSSPPELPNVFRARVVTTGSPPPSGAGSRSRARPAGAPSRRNSPARCAPRRWRRSPGCPGSRRLPQ